MTLVARFEVAGEALTFVLVHVHTSFAGSVHARELHALAAARPQLGRRLVVCGDFNTVPWSAQLGEFSESTGLRDAVRRLMAGVELAFMEPPPASLARPLPDQPRPFGPSGGSDHFPLVVDLAFTPLDRRAALRQSRLCRLRTPQ